MFNLKALTAKWYKPKVGGLFAMERKRVYRGPDNMSDASLIEKDITHMSKNISEKKITINNNKLELLKDANKKETPAFIDKNTSSEEKLKYYFEKIKTNYEAVKDLIPKDLQNVITVPFLKAVLIRENDDCNEKAKNPKSSASGLMQIVNGTFDGLVKNKRFKPFLGDKPDKFNADTSIKAAIAHFIEVDEEVKRNLTKEEQEIYNQSSSIRKQFILSGCYYAGSSQEKKYRILEGKEYARAVVFFIKHGNENEAKYTHSDSSDGDISQENAQIQQKENPLFGKDGDIDSDFEKKQEEWITKYVEYIEFKENDEFIKQKVKTILNIQEKIQNIELKVDSWGKLTKESEDKLSQDGLQFNRLISDLKLSSQDEAKLIGSLAEFFKTTTMVFLVKNNLPQNGQQNPKDEIAKKITDAINRGSKLGIHPANIEIKMVDDKNIDNNEIKGGFLRMFGDEMRKIPLEKDPKTELPPEEKEAILYNDIDKDKKGKILTELFKNDIYQSLIKAYNLSTNEFDADIDKANLEKYEKDEYALAKIKFLYLIKHAHLSRDDLERYGATSRSASEKVDESNEKISDTTIKALASMYALLHPDKKMEINALSVANDIKQIRELIELNGGIEAVKLQIDEMAKTDNWKNRINGLVTESKDSSEALQQLLNELKAAREDLVNKNDKNNLLTKQSFDCTIKILEDTIRRKNNVKSLESKIKDLEKLNLGSLNDSAEISVRDVQKDKNLLPSLKDKFNKQPEIKTNNVDEINQIIRQRASEASQILFLQDQVSNSTTINNDIARLKTDLKFVQDRKGEQVLAMKESLQNLQNNDTNENPNLNVLIDHLKNGVTEANLPIITNAFKKLPNIAEVNHLEPVLTEIENSITREKDLNEKIADKEGLLTQTGDFGLLLNKEEVAKDLFDKYTAALNGKEGGVFNSSADIIKLIDSHQTLLQARQQLNEEKKWLECCKCCENNPDYIGALLKGSAEVSTGLTDNQLKAIGEYIRLTEVNKTDELDYILGNADNNGVKAGLDTRLQAVMPSLIEREKDNSYKFNEENKKQIASLLSGGINFSEWPGSLKLALIAGALYLSAKKPLWAVGVVVAIAGGMAITGETSYEGLVNTVVEKAKSGLDKASESSFGRYSQWKFLDQMEMSNLKPELPEDKALSLVGDMPMTTLLEYCKSTTDLESFRLADENNCSNDGLIKTAMRNHKMTVPAKVGDTEVTEAVLRQAIYKVLILRGFNFANQRPNEAPANNNIQQCLNSADIDVYGEMKTDANGKRVREGGKPGLRIKDWIDDYVKPTPKPTKIAEAMAMAPLLLQEHLNNLQQAFKGAKYSIEEKTKRHWESAKNWTIDNFQVLDENNKRINVWDINIPDGTSVSGRLSIYYDEVTKEAKIFDKTKEILAPFNNEVIDVLSYVGLTKEAWLPAEVIKLHREGVGMFGDPVLTKLALDSTEQYKDKHLLTPQEVEMLGLTTGQINEYLDDKGGYYLLKQDNQATTAITKSKLWAEVEKTLPQEKQQKLTNYFDKPMAERFDIAKNEQNDKKGKLEIAENTINEVLKPLADAVDLAEEDFDGFLGVDALITDGLIKTAFTGEGGEFEDNLAKNLVLGIKADLFAQAYEAIKNGGEFGETKVKIFLDNQKISDNSKEKDSSYTDNIYTLKQILEDKALLESFFGKKNVDTKKNEYIIKSLVLIGTPNKDLHLKFYNELRGKFNDYDAWGQNKSMGGERIFAQVNNLYKEFMNTAKGENVDFIGYDKYLQDKIFSYLAKAYKDNTPTSLHVQDLKANPQEKLLTYEEYLIEQGGKMGEVQKEKEKNLDETGKNAPLNISPPLIDTSNPSISLPSQERLSSSIDFKHGIEEHLIKHVGDFNVSEVKEHLWEYVALIKQNRSKDKINEIIDKAINEKMTNKNYLIDHIKTYETALLQVENFNNDIDDIKNKTELWEYVKGVVANGLEDVVITEAYSQGATEHLREYIETYQSLQLGDVAKFKLEDLNKFVDYGLEKEFLGKFRESINKYIENYKIKQEMLTKNFINTNKLTVLDLEMVKSLKESPEKYLNLSGLKSLNYEVAKELVTLKVNSLDLSGLTSINFETAEVLSKFQGQILNLSGLKQLSNDIIKVLAQLPNSITLVVSENLKKEIDKAKKAL